MFTDLKSRITVGLRGMVSGGIHGYGAQYQESVRRRKKREPMDMGIEHR